MRHHRLKFKFPQKPIANMAPLVMNLGNLVMEWKYLKKPGGI